MLKKRRRKALVQTVVEEGEGNWLISYADMMTLMFGFFVIISSMSTPNMENIEKLKKETAKSIGTEYVKPHKEIRAAIEKILDVKKGFAIESTEKGVKITTPDSILFDSGQADLKEEFLVTLDQVAFLIQSNPNYNVIVEGHSDDIPINTFRFPSNWELSSARASSVIRYLEAKGVSSQRLQPVGFGSTQPIVPNRDVDGVPILKNNAINRRIVIWFIGNANNPNVQPSGSRLNSGDSEKKS